MIKYYEALYRYVEQFILMPIEDKERCVSTFKPLFVAKNTILEAAGTVPKYHNFIVSGHMRIFFINEKDEEVTVDLNEEPRFFSSYTHFVSQTVTNENLHCITDCEILQISIEDFRLSQISSLSSKEFTIKLFEQIMESDKQRMIDKNILTAEQRYIKFIKTNPKIYQNVPLKYMASYLGITQRHLSRLRGL